MIKDKRINSVKNRIAARCFGIWHILLLIVLLYRQFYLGQPASEYWDIALLFFVGTLYVTIASFASGAIHETNIITIGKWTVPVILITIVAVMYYQGQITTIVDLVESVLSAFVSLTVLGVLMYYLYRRWEKQIENS